MKQIIAAMIGTMITNNPVEIIEALRSERTDIQFLDRRHIQFMAALDLGPQWERLSKGPTLFLMDDDEKPFSVEQDSIE